MGYDPKQNIFKEYSRKFYSSSSIQMFFGSILIDDVAFLEYAVTNDKQPIYGYSSSYMNAVSRGRVLVTGSFMINFSRTPMIQVILDYIRKENNLTETEDIIQYAADNQVRMSNMISYYKYAHGDIAYPIGSIYGNSTNEASGLSTKAEELNALATEINLLTEQKQAMQIKDPLIVFPEHPKYDIFKEIVDKEYAKLQEYYQMVGISNSSTSILKPFNSDYVAQGSKDFTPQFLNSSLTPFGGFYVKDGKQVPFTLNKTIQAALQNMDQVNSMDFLTQSKTEDFENLMLYLENRLKSGPDSKIARIKRVDEHDGKIDNYLQRYIQNNTFDIIITYGDVNSPGAEATVKVINDVHIIGEGQTISAYEDGPILQRFTFFARNIDERPLNTLLDNTGNVIFGEATEDENIMDERNAIYVGDQTYKETEWLYGHILNAPYSMNHKQSYLPQVTKIPATVKIDNVEQTITPQKFIYKIDAMPVVDTCNISYKNTTNSQYVKVGVMLNLLEDSLIDSLIANNYISQSTNNISSNPISSGEIENDNLPVKIKVRLHIFGRSGILVSPDSINDITLGEATDDLREAGDTVNNVTVVENETILPPPPVDDTSTESTPISEPTTLLSLDDDDPYDDVKYRNGHIFPKEKTSTITVPMPDLKLYEIYYTDVLRSAEVIKNLKFSEILKRCRNTYESMPMQYPFYITYKSGTYNSIDQYKNIKKEIIDTLFSKANDEMHFLLHLMYSNNKTSVHCYNFGKVNTPYSELFYKKGQIYAPDLYTAAISALESNQLFNFYCVKSMPYRDISDGSGSSIPFRSFWSDDMSNADILKIRQYVIDAVSKRPEISEIIIHCTGKSYGTYDSIYDEHINWGMTTLGYHFLITNNYSEEYVESDIDGNIYVGRELWLPGRHTANHNKQSIAIALVGDPNEFYDYFPVPPFTPRQNNSLVKLIHIIKSVIPNINIYTHGDIDETVICPGFTGDIFNIEGDL